MKKSDALVTKYIPIGDMLRGQEFRSFSKLKRRTLKLVNPYRDDWLMAVFIKNNIFVNLSLMTKREIVEIFEAKKVSLVDEDGIYRVYIDDKVVGEWDNARTIRIDKYGRFTVKIRYAIH